MLFLATEEANGWMEPISGVEDWDGSGEEGIATSRPKNIPQKPEMMPEKIRNISRVKNKLKITKRG